jgi:cell division protein FtsB
VEQGLRARIVDINSVSYKPAANRTPGWFRSKMAGMKFRFTLFSVLALAGILLGWQLSAHYASTNTAKDLEITAKTIELGKLHQRIDRLETELATSKAQVKSLENTLSRQTRSQLETDSQQDDNSSNNASTHHQRPGYQSSLPSVDELTAAQIPLATADAIRDLIAQNRLALLQLRDQAEREGWFNTTRYAQALRKLLDPTHGIRTQFGDDIYDRYLYASGRANRVVATAVYPNSAASAAGIQAGDTILSYASKNVYSMKDLQQATVKGQAGESVLVVLERNGSTFSITLPRGPLGIELKMKSEAPQ